jgi:WD40 repeat protein
MSGNGRWVVSGGRDGTVRLRDRERPDHKPEVWRAHYSLVTGVAVSNDGRLVISSGDDGVILIRDREDPQAKPQQLRPQQALITSLTASGDGSWIASGGDDGTVWLWRRDQPQAPPSVWRGHEVSVNGVALSRDGRWLVFGQGDGTVRVGTVRVEDLAEKACKLAARNLSLAEWQRYLGDEPYRETCPGQPRPDNPEPVSKGSTPAQLGNGRP